LYPPQHQQADIPKILPWGSGHLNLSSEIDLTSGHDTRTKFSHTGCPPSGTYSYLGYLSGLLSCKQFVYTQKIPKHYRGRGYIEGGLRSKEFSAFRLGSENYLPLHDSRVSRYCTSIQQLLVLVLCHKQAASTCYPNGQDYDPPCGTVFLQDLAILSRNCLSR
jgi:hypothetical protein